MSLYRNTFRYFWMATLLIFVGLIGTPFPALAASTTVGFMPANSQVVLDQTVDVAVQIQDVVGLYGVDIAFTFDPVLLEVVDADPATGGIQVAQGTFLDAGLVVVNTADNTTGAAHFAMTQLNPSTAKDGTGTLIVVRLKGKAAGISTLNLTSVKLAARDGTQISSTSLSGQVEVVTSSSVPTSTALPTQDQGLIIPTSISTTASSMESSTPNLSLASPTSGGPTQASGTQTPQPTPHSASSEVAAFPSPTGGNPGSNTQAAAKTTAPLATQDTSDSPEGGQLPRSTAILVGLGIIAALIGIAIIAIVWRSRKR